MDIALDMMGGDFAPEELVKGVRDYISEKTPALVSLIGDVQQLKPLLDLTCVPSPGKRRAGKDRGPGGSSGPSACFSYRMGGSF